MQTYTVRLRPAVTDTPIQPGRFYHMGASSSPDLIFVTAVDDKLIYFMRQYELIQQYGADAPDTPQIHRLDRRIASDLIATANRTNRERAEQAFQNPDFILRQYPEDQREEIIGRHWLWTQDGGRWEESEKPYTCNCCGEEFAQPIPVTETTLGRLYLQFGMSPCCGGDYRKRISPMSQVGRRI